MRVAKVEGHEGLVRDMGTGAVLAGTTSPEYQDYRRKVEARNRILTLEREVSELKGMVSELLAAVREKNVQGQ